MIYIKDGGLWKEVSGKQFIPGMPMEGGFFGGFYALDGTLYALIIADKSAEQLLSWKTTNTASPAASSSTDGWANTNAINTVIYPAAQYTRQYDGGGFDDWYLGSFQELRTICATLLRTDTTVGFIAPDFATGGAQVLPTYLWTSQNASSTSAYRITTSSGNLLTTSKTNISAVRPIRKVPVSI